MKCFCDDALEAESECSGSSPTFSQLDSSPEDCSCSSSSDPSLPEAPGEPSSSAMTSTGSDGSSTETSDDPSGSWVLVLAMVILVVLMGINVSAWEA